MGMVTKIEWVPLLSYLAKHALEILCLGLRTARRPCSAFTGEHR